MVSFAPPTTPRDAHFVCIGDTFWVQKDDPDVGVRARTRLLELSAVFPPERLRDVVAPLLRPSSDRDRVSLRALDWTVTNYAKRHATMLYIADDGGGAVGAPARWFSIYNEYRAWLRAWRRKLFDPFARRSRVFFRVGEQWMATTPAQLNFIYFADQYGVLAWVRDHLAEVERDNNRALRRTREAKKQKRKRTALSSAPPVSTMIVDKPVRVTWE